MVTYPAFVPQPADDQVHDQVDDQALSGRVRRRGGSGRMGAAIVAVALALLPMIADVSARPPTRRQAPAGQWQIAAIDGPAETPDGAATLLGADGAISTFQHPRYHRLRSGRWRSERILAGSEFANAFAACFDGRGRAHLFYYGGPHIDFKHIAQRAGGGWRSETLPVPSNTPIGRMSCALDAGGAIHLTFCVLPGMQLHHLVLPSGGKAWDEELVSLAPSGPDNALALDGRGGLHALHRDGDRNLHYSHRWPGGSGWSTETIDRDLDHRLHPSLAVAPGGDVHAAYVVAGGGVRLRSRSPDGVWTERRLPSLPGRESDHTPWWIAVEPGGVVHLIYYAGADGAPQGGALPPTPEALARRLGGLLHATIRPAR